jgi:hypothetical protein
MKILRKNRIEEGGWSFLCVCGLLLMALASSGIAAPVGIVVYMKNPSVRSQSAFEYTYARPAGQVYYFGTVHRKKVRLLAGQIVACVTYPVLPPGNIVDEAPLNGMIRRYQAIIRQHPITKRFIDPRIAQINGAVNRIRSGEVLFNGAWISKSEYRSIMEREEKAAKDFANRKRKPKPVAPSMSSKERLAFRRKIENSCHKD